MSSLYLNLADVEAQLQAAGLLLETVTSGNGGALAGRVYVGSSKSVRCDVEGARAKKTGAYRLHELRRGDGILITGAYWTNNGSCYSTIELRKRCDGCGRDMGLKEKACPGCGQRKFSQSALTAEQLQAHKERMAELKRQAEAAAKHAADRAARWAHAVWLTCIEDGAQAHDYIARKKLAGAHGARIFPGNDGLMIEGATKEDYEYLGRLKGALVIPMCDDTGQPRGLQFVLSRTHHQELIARRGGKDKTYWPAGMANDGLHFLIGSGIGELCLVGEGFATCASLHEATGRPVAVAFDAAGLMKVGKRIWKHRKKRVRLLYCADDDWLQKCQACGDVTPVVTATCRRCGQAHGKANAGVERAQEAALATDGAWIAPQFAGARPDDKKGLTDYNDLRCLEGAQPVRAQIEARLVELGWGTPAPPSAPPAGNGGVPHERGEGKSARPQAVSIMALDDVVERFIHIDDGTGEYVFDQWTREICKRSKMTALLPARVRFDDVKEHPTWRQRAVYIDQVGFDPGGEDDNITCNRWTGWPIDPVAGKCEMLLELLRYQCAGEGEQAGEALYDWIIKWLAYPLQHPGAKMQTAIIMHGPQGTGKGRFFETYCRIFGEYGIVLNQGAIEDKFNSDWSERKLFILADEIVARADMYHLKNQLKNFVTGEWVRVNPKGLAAYRERNHMQIVFLSNEKQPLVLENDDRRYCVIWTPPPLADFFYNELSAEIENGGVAALYHHLLQVDLAGFKPWTKPPMTVAKRELIDVNRDSVERFLIDWKGGDIEGLPFCPCGSANLYTAYLGYCRANGERMPRPENQFSGHIVKLLGWEKAHKDVYESYNMLGTPKRKRMIIPSVHALTEAAQAGMKDYRPATDRLLSHYYTECYLDFQAGMKAEP